MNLGKTSIIGLVAVALSAFSPSPVRASLTFDFSYQDIATSGSSIQASGTLTTSDILTPNVAGTGVSGYQITDISGQRNNQAITGLNSNPNFPAINTYICLSDNAVDTSPYQFDYYGLSYFVGANEYNLFSQDNPVGGGYYEAVNGSQTEIPVDVTITPVPEPTTMCAGALLLLPFGLQGIRAVRNRKQAA
jgi:hypothetical protein